ncbi:MAG: cupin domain-containing protein [Gemmatimonadetes bacterium]|nr:cupin domain-containing protein [Gemmatimonadota bacterium]
MTNFSHFCTHVGADPEGFFKSTVFEGTSLRLGMSCLEPGQSQPEHTHDGQDKFYYVIEGHGEFVVGEETRDAGVGMLVWAPAGSQHGVTNNGSTRLVLLVGMAPSLRPSSKRRRLMQVKRVRSSAKRAARKVKKTAKRAHKAAGRAKKKAVATAGRARKAAKRARSAVKAGATKAKQTAKRAKQAATRAKMKASRTAKRTKQALRAARKRVTKTAKRARKAVRRLKKKR